MLKLGRPLLIEVAATCIASGLPDSNSHLQAHLNFNLNLNSLPTRQSPRPVGAPSTCEQGLWPHLPSSISHLRANCSFLDRDRTSTLHCPFWPRLLPSFQQTRQIRLIPRLSPPDRRRIQRHSDRSLAHDLKLAQTRPFLNFQTSLILIFIFISNRPFLLCGRASSRYRPCGDPLPLRSPRPPAQIPPPANHPPHRRCDLRPSAPPATPPSSSTLT